jgi:hypothetical protein
MMVRLIAFFRLPAAALVTCGYSFQDKHINDALVRGLQATPTAVAFGLCFGARDQYPTAVRLARERSNLTIVAKDGAVVGGREVAWAAVEAEARDDSKWIRWVPEVSGATQDKYRQEFLLGDFSYFGAFLQELTGRLR